MNFLFSKRDAARKVVPGRPARGLALCLAAASVAAGAWVAAPSAAPAQQRDISFVRDTETENTVRVYLAPIYEAAGLDPASVKIHLIQDNSINAFVAGGQKIFVHTGLFTNTDDPAEVIGVLAHEAGHITGGHLSRFQEGLENAQIKSIAALVLGVPAAIASGRADVAAAATALGQHIGQRSLLQYTREMEQSADQAAMDFLRQAGISPEGYKTVLGRLAERARLYSGNPNPYTQSHPITESRIAFVENQIAQWGAAMEPLPDSYESLHDRTKAKLIGYIMDPKRTLQTYPESDKSLPARYARAIAHMQAHRTEEALAITEALIAENPEDPFFHELKGDILLDAGRVEEAIAPFRQAVEMLPWAALIRINLARAMLELNDPQYEDEALDHLRHARRYEPDSSELWRLTAAAYSRKGETGQVALAQAERAVRSGQNAEAVAHAERAMGLFKEGTATWLRAQDISIQARDRQKKNDQ